MSKISTNLTRLAVSKNAHTKLALIYSKNLRVLAKMPSDYTYRYVHWKDVFCILQNSRIDVLCKANIEFDA